jgi:hypothetical protein
MCPSKKDDSAADFHLAATRERYDAKTVREDDSSCTDLLSTSAYEVASIELRRQRYRSVHGIPHYTDASKSDTDVTHVFGDGNDCAMDNVESALEENGSTSEAQCSQASHRRIETCHLCSPRVDEVILSPSTRSGFEDTPCDILHATDHGTSFDGMPELVSQLQKDNILVVKIHWELFEFCRDELDGEHDISPVLVACGTASRAYSTTCSEYVARLWPKHGPMLLNTIISFLSTDSITGFVSHHDLSDNTPS